MNILDIFRRAVLPMMLATAIMAAQAQGTYVCNETFGKNTPQGWSVQPAFSTMSPSWRTEKGLVLSASYAAHGYVPYAAGDTVELVTPFFDCQQVEFLSGPHDTIYSTGPSQWFPKDAKWIYMRPSPSGPEVEAVQFYVKGDTVINEKKCVMTNISTYFLGGKGLCFYEEKDSVFYYNETTESFQILYDFSLQAGDSYVICPSDRFINDSLIVFIDSVTSVWVNGVSLRVQYVHTQSVSHTERPNFWQIGDMNKAVIYETIGSLNFFIPQEDGWNDDFFSHLCQYSGNGICFKSNPDEDCVSNIGIPEVENGSDIRMKGYPNPVSGMLHIQLADAEKGIVRITVCDLLGKVVLQRENLSKPELDVSALPRGMYLLQVQTTDGKSLTAKFVKE